MIKAISGGGKANRINRESVAKGVDVQRGNGEMGGESRARLDSADDLASDRQSTAYRFIDDNESINNEDRRVSYYVNNDAMRKYENNEMNEDES